MTLTDIVIKILLFFTVFYGAIFISAYVGKKIREKNNLEDSSKKEENKKN